VSVLDLPAALVASGLLTRRKEAVYRFVENTTQKTNNSVYEIFKKT